MKSKASSRYGKGGAKGGAQNGGKGGASKGANRGGMAPTTMYKAARTAAVQVVTGGGKGK